MANFVLERLRERVYASCRSRVVEKPHVLMIFNIMWKFLIRKYTMIFRYAVIFRVVLGLAIRVQS